MRAWCGLAGLPAVVRRLGDRLRTYRDERGRTLLDVHDGVMPDADVPAPVRFLPAFDNAVLAYDDRSRVIADEHRGLSVEGARFVLVDGRVAATWTVTDGAVAVMPLTVLGRSARRDVADEGERLSAFLGGSATVAWPKP